MALTTLPFYWIAPGRPELVFTFNLLHAVVGGINATLFWALVADTADFAEWKFNVRTTGIIFSAMTCAQKIGMGVGGWVAGLLLTNFGYVANVMQQSAHANHGILLLMSVIPAAGFIVVAAVFSRYGLTETVCEEIRTDLGGRRAAREATAEPLLTGP